MEQTEAREMESQYRKVNKHSSRGGLENLEIYGRLRQGFKA